VGVKEGGIVPVETLIAVVSEKGLLPGNLFRLTINGPSSGGLNETTITVSISSSVGKTTESGEKVVKIR